jgi:aldose 1-epimerase
VDLYEYKLGNGAIRLSIINSGATITSLQTPDRYGRLKNIVAGFAGFDDYWRNEYYLGCVVGRYANRIGGGRFMLDGHPVQLSINNDGNHLHGGFKGLSHKIWRFHSNINTADEAGIVLEHVSPDGDEGYPGTLRLELTYLLDKKDRLSVIYKARTDKPTPVSLTNHSYFNLSGFEDPVVGDHLLLVHADRYTEKNDRNLPTGRLLPVAGSPMDFSTFRRIGENIGLLPLDRGYDHNFVLGPELAVDDAKPRMVIPAAELYEPRSGRQLNVLTDQPGLQVYTANWWDGSVTGEQGCSYVQHGAVALETQAFPDSPNQPAFPDTILRPGQLYQTTTIFEFNTK